MTISEQASGINTSSQPTDKKDNRSIFAFASLVIGVLDIPAMFCGWFFAFAFGVGGYVAVSLFSVAAPFLFCFAGIASGIVGLRSKHRVIAIIGIILSGMFLLMGFGYLGYSLFIMPNISQVFEH